MPLHIVFITLSFSCFQFVFKMQSALSIWMIGFRMSEREHMMYVSLMTENFRCVQSVIAYKSVISSFAASYEWIKCILVFIVYILRFPLLSTLSSTIDHSLLSSFFYLINSSTLLLFSGFSKSYSFLFFSRFCVQHFVFYSDTTQKWVIFNENKNNYCLGLFCFEPKNFMSL